MKVISTRFECRNRSGLNIVGRMYHTQDTERTASTVIFADRLNATKNNGFCDIMAENYASKYLRTVNIDFTFAPGESYGSIGDATVSKRAADIVDTIKYLSYEKVMDRGCNLEFVGCGVGSVVALKLASASGYGSRVKAVVGIDSAFSMHAVLNDLVFGTPEQHASIEDGTGDIIYGNNRVDRGLLEDYFANIRTLCETMPKAEYNTLLCLSKGDDLFLGKEPIFKTFGRAFVNFQTLKDEDERRLISDCRQFLYDHV